MSLDLAATLFGGVVALLPIFARDILQINSWGFGLLRAAPATGALIVAVILSRIDISRSGGRIMFAAVAVYGAATIAFGFSGNCRPASLAMLMVLGGADMLSTVIRQSLIQFATPDDMRGRVFAVNALFVNSAGQIGMFEFGRDRRLVRRRWFGRAWRRSRTCHCGNLGMALSKVTAGRAARSARSGSAELRRMIKPAPSPARASIFTEPRSRYTGKMSTIYIEFGSMIKS